MSDEPIKVNVVQEVPDNCDSCGAGLQFLNPIKQRKKTSFGYDFMVIGYICESCDTSHLYQMPSSNSEIKLGKPLEISSQID